MKKRFVLILILVIISLGAAYLQTNMEALPNELRITGLVGGEKIGLFENKNFQNYLKDNYNLKIDYRKAGSIDMVQGDMEGLDYLFPASQMANELYKLNSRPSVEDDIVFNTPVVLYTRDKVSQALIEQDIVEDRQGVYYLKMDKLAELMEDEASWSDIGLGDLYGNIIVDTTDPNKSNSGNMFLGLLANSLNQNQVVQKEDLGQIKPKIQKIYSQIGYMQGSSADMFSQFLTQGLGAYPIIAGYENQIIEFAQNEPETYDKVKDDLVILYPEPTVWSSHVYIAISEEATRGLDALKDPYVQELAWKDHGFRTVVAGASEDPFQIQGLADDINQVMPMPSYEVMEELMELVE